MTRRDVVLIAVAVLLFVAVAVAARYLAAAAAAAALLRANHVQIRRRWNSGAGVGLADHAAPRDRGGSRRRMVGELAIAAVVGWFAGRRNPHPKRGTDD